MPLKVVSPPQIRLCLCGFEAFTKSDLAIHAERNECQIYRCHCCRLRTYSRKCILFHKEHKNYMCEVCSETFMDLSGHQAHMNSSHGKKTLERVKQPIEKKTKVDSYKMHCPATARCLFRCNKISALKQHFREKHPGRLFLKRMKVKAEQKAALKLEQKQSGLVATKDGIDLEEMKMFPDQHQVANEPAEEEGALDLPNTGAAEAETVTENDLMSDEESENISRNEEYAESVNEVTDYPESVARESEEACTANGNDTVQTDSTMDDLLTRSQEVDGTKIMSPKLEVETAEQIVDPLEQSGHTMAGIVQTKVESNLDDVADLDMDITN